jgi:hypothetical protein
MSFDLRIEQIGDEHIEPYMKLSRSEFGDEAPVSRADHLRWKFIDNPQGPSIGIHLYKNGELVGRMVALTRNFLYRGKIFKAAHIVDFLVHAEERGMNSLFQLATALKKLSGYDFLLIMAPNPAGAAVWEKFVKMRGYFDLNVSVAPLRPVALLHSAGKIRSAALAPVVDLPWQLLCGTTFRLMGAFSHVSIDTNWPKPEEFVRMFSGDWGDRVVGERTAEYLDWRYRRGPVFRYSVYFLREDNELSGYLVTRRTVYDGIDCLFVVDAFGKPETRRSSWRSASIKGIRRVGARTPEMAMLLGNTNWGPLEALDSLPFLTVPQRRLPRKTTVYAEWMNAPGFEIRKDNFYVALGDSDVI